jgi:hypothetical protein
MYTFDPSRKTGLLTPDITFRVSQQMPADRQRGSSPPPVPENTLGRPQQSVSTESIMPGGVKPEHPLVTVPPDSRAQLGDRSGSSIAATSQSRAAGHTRMTGPGYAPPGSSLSGCLSTHRAHYIRPGRPLRSNKEGSGAAGSGLQGAGGSTPSLSFHCAPGRVSLAPGNYLQASAKCYNLYAHRRHCVRQILHKQERQLDA